MELSTIVLSDVDLLDLRRVSVVFRKQVAEHWRLLWTSNRALCESFDADSNARYLANVEEQRELNRVAWKQRGDPGSRWLRNQNTPHLVARTSTKSGDILLVMARRNAPPATGFPSPPSSSN